jgi:hypothetical protein
MRKPFQQTRTFSSPFLVLAVPGVGAETLLSTASLPVVIDTKETVLSSIEDKTTSRHREDDVLCDLELRSYSATVNRPPGPIPRERGLSI